MKAIPPLSAPAAVLSELRDQLALPGDDTLPFGDVLVGEGFCSKTAGWLLRYQAGARAVSQPSAPGESLADKASQ